MSENNNMNWGSWMLLIVLSILWGGSFFFVEIALQELPIFTIVYLRVFIGAIILVLYIFITGRSLPKKKSIWLKLLIMGFLNNVIPFSLIVTGQQYISGGFASILNATTPFFTVIATHFFTSDEKINMRKIMGVLIGILGVFVLIGSDKILLGSNKVIGVLAILGAAISYAFAGTWGKRFKSDNLDPVVLSTGQLICSSTILLPIMLMVNKPWNLALPSLNIWMAILGIALFSTAIAYIIYFKILSTSGATNVHLVTLLVPVSAILLGVFILSEHFSVNYLMGMIIIGAGLVVIDGRILNLLRRKKLVRR